MNSCNIFFLRPFATSSRVWLSALSRRSILLIVRIKTAGFFPVGSMPILESRDRNFAPKFGFAVELFYKHKLVLYYTPYPTWSHCSPSRPTNWTKWGSQREGMSLLLRYGSRIGAYTLMLSEISGFSQKISEAYSSPVRIYIPSKWKRLLVILFKTTAREIKNWWMNTVDQEKGVNICSRCSLRCISECEHEKWAILSISSVAFPHNNPGFLRMSDSGRTYWDFVLAALWRRFFRIGTERISLLNLRGAFNVARSPGWFGQAMRSTSGYYNAYCVLYKLGNPLV